MRIIVVIFVALFTAWLMWSSKNSFVSIITPKSFCFSIVSSGYMELLSVIEYFISPMLLFPVVMCLHLLGLNFNNHLLLHCSKVFKSSCKVPWSFLSVIILNILMSSANINVSDLVSSGRSFMYSTKSNGLITEPWGIPEITSCYLDFFTIYSYLLFSIC